MPITNDTLSQIMQIEIEKWLDLVKRKRTKKRCLYLCGSDKYKTDAVQYNVIQGMDVRKG